MKKKEKGKEKDKKKITIIIVILIVLLLIGAFLFWWFNRKFDVTIKYNNGTQDNLLKVKYLRKVDLKDINEEIANDSAFIGFYETYYLNGEEISKLKNDNKLKETICKENFKLDDSNTKCIAEKEFDFENTKIKKNTTIEAFYSGLSFSINPTSKTILVGENFKITANISGTKDKTVTFKSNDKSIATVDNNGKVVGVKKGSTTIIAMSNGISKKCVVTVNEKTTKKVTTAAPKDEGTISLKANDQCIVGKDEVTITATVSNNALDKTINWDSNLKCYNVNKTADNVLKISRIGRGTMCREIEELNPVIKASLNNGNSDSLKLTYESNLTFKVYNNDNEISYTDYAEGYLGNNITIKTNVDASFTAVAPSNTSVNRVKSKTNNSVTLVSTSDAVVTIKTSCGQSKTIKVFAVIN